MTKEQQKAIRDLAISIAREDTVKPFLRELAGLLEKYELVLEFVSELDSVDILRGGDVIYEVSCRHLSPFSIREEAEEI